MIQHNVGDIMVKVESDKVKIIDIIPQPVDRNGSILILHNIF